MDDINIRTQKREAFLWRYLFSLEIPSNPLMVNHSTQMLQNTICSKGHQNTEVDVTFKTNTFSSYQATKTTKRKMNKNVYRC